MATKLTTKSVRIYALLSIGALIIVAPIFYFMIGRLWIKDIDESMIYERQELQSNIESGKLTIDEFEKYAIVNNKLGGTINITPLSEANKPLKDSIYYCSKYDDIHKHKEPYRVFRTSVEFDKRVYQVIITRDLVESEDLVESIIVLFLTLFIILLILTFVVMQRYSVKLWQPFFSMVERLKEVKLSRESSIDIECKDVYEFEQLHSSVNDLLARNHSIFIAQKEFTENAAHEMQTPIAVIKMQVDILRQNNLICNSEAGAIQSISNNARYMTSLSRNLLLLSKIENRQYLLSDKVDINSILQSLVNNISEELAMVNKEVLITGKSKTLYNCNEVLFKSLCNNLLTNAVKYSKSGSCIDVKLSESHIIFSNIGMEIPLDKVRIFNRFYKGNPLTMGSGLGLSIVKSICEILNFEVDYLFEEAFEKGGKHTFVIKF